MSMNISCMTCPYIADDMARVLDDEICVSSCYCDKVGGKIAFNGFCDEVALIDTRFEPNDNVVFHHDSNKDKARQRRKADIKNKRRLKKLAKSCKWYQSPAYGVDVNGHWTDDEEKIVYYRKCNKSSHATRFKYHKKQAHKAVRRNFKIDTDYEWYAINDEPIEDEEYRKLYCDENTFKWDIREVIVEDEKSGLGCGKSAYKKLYDWKWNVW